MERCSVAINILIVSNAARRIIGKEATKRVHHPSLSLLLSLHKCVFRGRAACARIFAAPQQLTPLTVLAPDADEKDIATTQHIHHHPHKVFSTIASPKIKKRVL